MVKVVVDVKGGNVVEAYGEEEGLCIVRNSDLNKTTGMQLTVDPSIVTEAEKEMVFTSEDLEDEDTLSEEEAD